MLTPRVSTAEKVPPIYIVGVEKGHYMDIHTIFEKITSKFVQLSNNIQNNDLVAIKFDYVTRKVIMRWKLSAFPTSYLGFEDELSYILGFNKVNEIQTGTEIKLTTFKQLLIK